MKTGTESNGTVVWINLDVTNDLVEVCGDNDVDRLNCSRERLVQILLLDLKFEQSSIDLVDDDNRLDTLTKSLSKHGLGLDTDTLDGVHDDEGTIGGSESCSDFGREIDVTWRVDQVDQELVAGNLLGDVLQVIFILQLAVQRDGSRLDGNTSILLILTGVGESTIYLSAVVTAFLLFVHLRLTSLGGRNDTGTLDKGVGKGRFSVVDVSNDTLRS